MDPNKGQRKAIRSFRRFLDSDDRKKRQIVVKNADASGATELLAAMEDNREKAKKRIGSFAKKYLCGSVSRAIWKAYRRTYFDPFADASFGYAITVHKSQGSTMEFVVVDADDIVRGDMPDQRQLLYTACTRASRALWIVQ